MYFDTILELAEKVALGTFLFLTEGIDFQGESPGEPPTVTYTLQGFLFW